MDKEFFLSAAGVPPPLHFEAPSPFPASLWGAELNPFPVDDHRFQFQRAWEKSTEQFPSLDSLVSSSAPNSGFPRDGSAIRELIGKLGNISTTAFAGNAQPPPATSTAAMEIPMPPPSSSPRPYVTAIDTGGSAEFNSPPVAGNLNPIAAEFPGDPGFVERAAKFSRFGGRSFNGPGSAESAQRSNSLLCRVSGTPSRKPAGLYSRRDGAQDGKVNRSARASPPSHAELGNVSQGDSSVSEQFPSGNSNPRKRKAACRNKPKEISSAKPPKVNGESEDDAKTKRCRAGEGNRNCSVKAEEDAKADGSPKPPEPPKDYIHVRARRGQATDSHSLAERVRREKISERMKLLQDLVPGCNKVTGKALMLDEIINYVQSLQRQVEFLSMKLANVDFRPDFSNMQSILQKDVSSIIDALPQMFQTSGALTHTVYDPQLHSFGQNPQQNPPLPTSTSNFPSGKQCSVGLLDNTLGANQLHSIHGFIDQAVPQLPTICQDDLQSIVQMGLGSNLNRGTETMNYRAYSE